MKTTMLFSTLLVLSSHTVFAQSSAVSLPATSATPTETSTADTSDLLSNKKFEEAHDITDAKLKADAGSLSKYSLKFNLSYYGPTLNDLSAKDQPNPDGSIGTYETALGGSLGARYRLDSNSSISAGSGLKAIHPLNGFERFDLNSPFISYDMLNRVGGVQMRNSPGVSLVTVKNYKAVGEFASFNYDFSMIYNLGSSNAAIGLDSSLGYFLYNRSYVPKDRKAARYNIAFFPNVKYNFTDKFNVNTSFSMNYWNARSIGNQIDLQSRTISQRLAIGYAFSRDVYFAPYLNFYPNRLGTASTTINISTTFSLL